MATYTYVECMHVCNRTGLFFSCCCCYCCCCCFPYRVNPYFPVLRPGVYIHTHPVFLFSRKSCFEIHSFSPRLCLQPKRCGCYYATPDSTAVLSSLIFHVFRTRRSKNPIQQSPHSSYSFLGFLPNPFPPPSCKASILSPIYSLDMPATSEFRLFVHTYNIIPKGPMCEHGPYSVYLYLCMRIY